MRSIGFDDAGIGLMIALYSAVMLLVETPSGILADRWSRKGVLVLASVALIASSLIAGLSNSELVFLVSSAMWGVYFALYSGTYDSIVYDTVLEETADSKGFDTYYGRIRTLDSIALVISSLAGGALANAAGLRAPYFVSIIFAVLAIVALALFKEPRLHKSEVHHPISKQIVQTFGAVLNNRKLLPVMAVSVLLSVMLYMVLEFSQVWLIALQTPTTFFGIANAVLLTSLGLGGLLAGWKRISQSQLLVAVTICLATSSAGLILFRSTALIVAAEVVYCTVIVASMVIFTRLLHDQLSSKIRAGASSAVNTFSRIIIIPLALLFGYISRETSIFQSAYLLVVFAVIVSAIILRYFVFKRQLAVDATNTEEM